MIRPPLPDNERERLDALYAYGILDTEQETDFDELVHLASHICQTPISLVTLIDRDRQWFKAKTGMAGTETPRDTAFCAHAILSDKLMVVPDARKDPRFVDNPFVLDDPNVRFYAGMPLNTPNGFNLGTLCVIDSEPRELDDSQKKALEILGRHAMKLLELRRRNQELRRLGALHKRMLAIIGHDLKSPMNSIRSLLSLLESEDIGVDEFRILTTDLGHMVDSSSDLLTNLLDWAASQLNERKIFRKPIPMRMLVDRMERLTGPVLAAKGNRLINEVDSTHHALGDRHLTEFILRNLIMNAHKFMEAGTVTISSHVDGATLTLRVSDTGPGVDATLRSTLFDWNVKTTTTGSKGEKGSGLGLPMSREFAETQGGRLELMESTAGALFEFTLPTI